MRFLDITRPYSDYSFAHYAVLPIPFEKTTSYIKGTRRGPEAILKASQQVELYDHELDNEPYLSGITTLKPLTISSSAHFKEIENSLSKLLQAQKKPISLGGEHSISIPLVRAAKHHYPDLSVLIFDAHADLRDRYKGTSLSHACVTRRLLEICPVVQVGVRSLDIEEAHFAKNSQQWAKIHWAEKLELVEKIVSQLSSHVYISIDLDVFDPSIMPAVGTPEPGGMDYYEVLDILRGVMEKKKVIGLDLVELCPLKGQIVSEFLAARLVYKLIGYWNRNI